MVICGIDPGLKGGVGFLDGKTGAIIEHHVMPSHMGELAILLTKWRDKCGARGLFVFCERAQVMSKPGAKPQGICSMFNYGVGYGQILGILITLRIPYELIPPVSWTRLMHAGLPLDLKPKAKSLLVARRIFPGETFLASERSRIPHDGLIDADLIAEYGRRRLNPSYIAPL